MMRRASSCVRARDLAACQSRSRRFIPLDTGYLVVMLALIIVLLLLFLLFGGLGFAMHTLWIVAAILLVAWIISLVVRMGQGSGSRV
jgi:hypothetical protein